MGYKRGEDIWSLWAVVKLLVCKEYWKFGVLEKFYSERSELFVRQKSFHFEAGFRVFQWVILKKWNFLWSYSTFFYATTNLQFFQRTSASHA